LELVSKQALKDMMRESGGRQQAYTETGLDVETPLDKKPKDITVDAERNEALESERPGDAVFKAIFGSDDEDDND
jgi:G patch domain-containing protein 1